MGRVRIVTDSSAQFLDPTVIDRYQIEVVPLTISLPTRSFREGIDLDSEAFLRSVAGQRTPARLEAPSAETFANLYTRLNHETDHIVSIHFSSGLGEVWNNARQGARTLLGRCEIEVIDSLTASAGLGMLVEEAGLAVAEGASFEEVVHRVRGMVSRVYSVFYVGSLDYLRHNNLISEAQAVLGSMLDIKPVLSIEEGALIPIEKVRTDSQAIDRLVEFVIEFSDIAQLVILQHTLYATEQTRLLRDRLAFEFPEREFPVALYRPSLGALIGPDAMGMMICEALPEDGESV
ncbi:MAG: DegV family protein [Anaerolineae bacterium]|nr:DegV family protein [Anaerolineae bacterium]